jgi:Arc/MetJ-type ribon-helix-helix transcriptional regulator
MHANVSPNIVAPARRRRRRSPSSDPLKKVTLQLSESVLEAIKSVIEAGEAASANAFVEDAVRTKLRERRRVKIYAAYEEASRDPAFLRDMNADLDAFDATVADGLSPAR